MYRDLFSVHALIRFGTNVIFEKLMSELGNKVRLDSLLQSTSFILQDERARD